MKASNLRLLFAGDFKRNKLKANETIVISMRFKSNANPGFASLNWTELSLPVSTFTNVRRCYVHKQCLQIRYKKNSWLNKWRWAFCWWRCRWTLQTADDCGLYWSGWHGNESPRYCERISNYICRLSVFLPLTDDDNVEWKIKDYYDVAGHVLCFTPETTASLCGSGKKFNHKF